MSWRKIYLDVGKHLWFWGCVAKIYVGITLTKARELTKLCGPAPQLAVVQWHAVGTKQIQ